MRPFRFLCSHFSNLPPLLSLIFLIPLFLLPACSVRATPVSVAPVTGLPQGTDSLPWWNDSVFYEIFVRSYADSDGDGIGDFNGLISKLDYLNDGKPETTTDLGITGLWLMPINPSPSYHGYDVSDYYAVNPQYGTLEDFKKLLAEAHQRGIRVIIDMVMNHTSVENAWFQESKDPSSPRRNWYIWSDKDPGYTGPWGEKVWYQSGKSYYYAIFDASMPDLNYTNPEVRAEMEKVARFWLEDVGVDGFRLDAAKHIVEEAQVQENTQATHTWWKEFHQAYKADNPQALTVGEVWSSTDQVAGYLQGDELDLAFNFDLAGNILKSVSGGSSFNLRASLETSSRKISPSQFATFLTNHDQNRTSSQLGENTDKARQAATVLMTLPGVPFVYYGEEIGMTGMKPDPNLRTLMQWSADTNAGFTPGNLAMMPLNNNYLQVNFAAQTNEPASLLSHYRSLVRLRNNHAALRVGDYVQVESSASQVLAFLRVSQAETVLVIINLSKDPLSDCGLSLGKGPLLGEYKAALLFESQFPKQSVKILPPEISPTGGFTNYLPLSQDQTLPAYSSLVIQLQAVKSGK